MRLIDADYLLYEQGAKEVEEFAEAIANCPTIEQKRGHWEHWAGNLEKCSVCGYEYIDRIECRNYCGNCGAKMDEVAE